MRKLGFGIIGLGMIASVHVEAISSLDDAYFVSGFDRMPGRADQFCALHGGKPYDNLEKFLADQEIDVVTITTSSGAHLDVALAAMHARKHVIIEKPMEVTTERCDRLIKTAKECHVVLAGVFQSRFYDAPQLVKKAIEEGRYGKLTMLDAQVKWFRTQEYYDAVKWHGTWKMGGGGALMNQAIHAIDLLQWFGGPVAEVVGYTAMLAHERIEVEDTAVATLRFKSGALGVIEGTTAAYPGFLKRIDVCGDKGCSILEEEDLRLWQFQEERPEDATIRKNYASATSSGGGASDPKAISSAGHAKLFANVIQSILTGEKPMVDGEEARKAVAIIEAIYESAKTHHSVCL